MKLTADQVYKLPINSVLYYNEYSPASEKTLWDDIVQIIEKDDYGSPKFRILAKLMKNSEIGDEASAGVYEISNGRAYAIPDKDTIMKLIFERALW